jgi:hypothetical protein
MATLSDSAIFLGIMVSLIASSFCISWIVNDYAQSPICGIGQTCAPINLGLQDFPTNGTVENQDYTNITAFNTTLIQVSSGFLSGTWTQGPTGYVLTSSTIPLIGRDPVLKLPQIIGIDGEYTVQYVIDNPTGSPFYITPRTDDSQDTVWTSSDGDYYEPLKIPLYFDSQGVSIQKNMNTDGDILTETIPDVQVTNPGGSTYIVIFNKNTNRISVIKDGTTLFDRTGLNIQTPTVIPMTTYYGGVSSNTVGFTLISTSALRAFTPTNEDVGDSYIGDLINVAAGTIPGLSQVLQLLGIMAQIILWTLPESIFPLWLNMILIKPQLIILLYIGAKLARGGG